MTFLLNLLKKAKAAAMMSPANRNKTTLQFIDSRMELWRHTEANVSDPKLKAMAAARLSELASVRKVLA